MYINFYTRAHTHYIYVCIYIYIYSVCVCVCVLRDRRSNTSNKESIYMITDFLNNELDLGTVNIKQKIDG